VNNMNIYEFEDEVQKLLKNAGVRSYKKKAGEIVIMAKSIVYDTASNENSSIPSNPNEYIHRIHKRDPKGTVTSLGT